MNYFETPADVLENAGELVTWARRSVDVAMRAPNTAAKTARRRPKLRRR
jgi:TfoX/Sxy family transcriptional regulator of competence genes